MGLTNNLNRDLLQDPQQISRHLILLLLAEHRTAPIPPGAVVTLPTRAETGFPCVVGGNKLGLAER